MPQHRSASPLSPGSGHRLLAGVACGAAAGGLWGLVFLAPALASSFSPLQLTVGRYLCYGLLALLLLGPRLRLLAARVTRQQWLMLGWLSLTGNTLYYLLLASAVQNGGGAMTSLVIGLMPVVITVIGSRDKDAVPLSSLVLSLLLCTAAAVCISWQALAVLDTRPLQQRLVGLLCATGALASWTTYAVANARCLAAAPQLSSHEWSLLTGMVAGAQNLLLLPMALLVEAGSHSNNEWLQFAGLSFGVALLASIVGNALWNRMSRLLPLTLVGQMILFETLFALIYGLAWEQRLPTPLEAAAFILVVLSVLSCMAAHRPRQSAAVQNG